MTRRDLLFLTLTLGCLFFIMLGARPLFVPDEGRYAEIAREMLVSGDFMTPHLNGIIYFEKPVLFYWLGALAFKLGGFHIWAIRSVNALIGLSGCLLTYLATAKLYDARTGLLAALILGSNLMYFLMSHMVSLDLPITVFISASLYAFLLGYQTPLGRTRRLYLYGATTAAALAVLTKGLIGIVFPIMIIATWLLLINDLRALKRLYLPSCCLLFLFITVPWHALVEWQHPGFFHFYFIEQHFLRYTDQSIGHYEPIGFFIPYLIIGFLPWIVFLPQAVRISLPTHWSERVKSATPLFFLIWALLVFLFFSFSKSKLIPYILPMFPALAIMTARYVAMIRVKIITIIFISTWITLLALLAAIPLLDTRTVQPLATILSPILKPEDDVITYNQYFQDLPFYLQRRVSILNWQNELRYGMQQEDTHAWMINDQIFWQRWTSKQRIYVIISQSEFTQLQRQHPGLKYAILGKSHNNLLVSNNPSPLDMAHH